MVWRMCGYDICFLKKSTMKGGGSQLIFGATGTVSHGWCQGPFSSPLQGLVSPSHPLTLQSMLQPIQPAGTAGAWEGLHSKLARPQRGRRDHRQLPTQPAHCLPPPWPRPWPRGYNSDTTSLVPLHLLPKQSPDRRRHRRPAAAASLSSSSQSLAALGMTCFSFPRNHPDRCGPSHLRRAAPPRKSDRRVFSKHEHPSTGRTGQCWVCLQLRKCVVRETWRPIIWVSRPLCI